MSTHRGAAPQHKSGRPPAKAAPRGQSLVEFALMLLFLTFLLMGILDLGRAYFTYLAIKDAAAEGAYFGSAFPQCVDADGVDLDHNGLEDEGAGCAGTNNIDYRARNSAPRGGLVDWSSNVTRVTTTLTTTVSQDVIAGQNITVSVSTQYRMLTPLVSAIVPGQIVTFTASSSAVIIRVTNCAFSPCQ
jgi:Flp pilus assembly protein TadG